MYALEQLQKQQVGLRLPKYLIDEIDAFTKEYSLNRSEIIIESIKAFILEQKARKIYDSFDVSCKELKDILDSDDDKHLISIEELIDEFEH
jgi:metal-responsive CopG/Arc/MetJ family transcriptional regulator